MSNFSIKEDVKGFHIFLDITGDYMCTTDNINTATAIIEALENRIPKTVKYNTEQFPCCPICWRPYSLKASIGEYCDQCGQMLMT